MMNTVYSKAAGEPLKKSKSIHLKRFNLSSVSFSLSLIMILVLILCALFPGVIAPYSPFQMNQAVVMSPPSFTHVFGTDQFGRDMFSLIVYGTRQSLMMGLLAVLLGGFTGTVIGLLAGYFGGIIDTIFMRLTDILLTIPNILLAIAISAALGPSLLNIIVAVSFSAVPNYARVIRGQVIAIKSRPYIDASKTIGMPRMKIIMRHVLPNCSSQIIVMAALGIGTSILISTGLSFLGLGVIKEIPDWGYLLSQGRSYITIAWWIVTFPGLVITLLVIAVNILGDELRDRLDPKRTRA
jgi:peptide/nickel transport system permease protein